MRRPMSSPVKLSQTGAVAVTAPGAIATSTELHADLQGFINIGPETWHFDAVLKAPNKRRVSLCEVGQWR